MTALANNCYEIHSCTSERVFRRGFTEDENAAESVLDLIPTVIRCKDAQQQVAQLHVGSDVSDHLDADGVIDGGAGHRSSAS